MQILAKIFKVDHTVKIIHANSPLMDAFLLLLIKLICPKQTVLEGNTNKKK